MNSLMDASIMSNESLQASFTSENSHPKVWQSYNGFKNNGNSPFFVGGSAREFQGVGISSSPKMKGGLDIGVGKNIQGETFNPRPYHQGYSRYDRTYNNQPFDLYERGLNFGLQQLGMPDNQEQLANLRTEIVMKNQIIKNLSEQLTEARKIKACPHLCSKGDFTVPKNHYELFNDLSDALKKKTAELEDTKERFEALAVALAMDNQKSISLNGQFDEQELAHKIVTKLSVLQSENDNLLDMISSSSKTSALVELRLLQNENRQLKEKLKSKEK